MPLSENPEDLKQECRQKRREQNKKHSADARARALAKQQESELKVAEYQNQIDELSERISKTDKHVKFALEMMIITGQQDYIDQNFATYEEEKKKIIEKFDKEKKANELIRTAEEKMEEIRKSFDDIVVNYSKTKRSTWGSRKSRAKQTYLKFFCEHIVLNLEHDIHCKTALAAHAKQFFVAPALYLLLFNPVILSNELDRLGRQTELEEFNDFVVKNPDLFKVADNEEATVQPDES